jgi:hypothetical protein
MAVMTDERMVDLWDWIVVDVKVVAMVDGSDDWTVDWLVSY